MSIVKLNRDKLDEEAAILFKQKGYTEDKDRTIQRAGLFLKGLRENYYHTIGNKPNQAGPVDPYISQYVYTTTKRVSPKHLIDISFNDGSEMNYFSCLTNKYFANPSSHPDNEISEEISKYIRFLFSNIENKSAMNPTEINTMLRNTTATHPFTYALIHALFDVPALTFRPRLNIAMCLSSNIQNQIVAKTGGGKGGLNIDSTDDLNIYINQLLQFIYIVTIPVIPSTITIEEVVCIGQGRGTYYALFLVNMTQEMKQTALRKLAEYIGQNSDMELFNRSTLNAYIDTHINAYKTKMDMIVDAYKKANSGTPTTPGGLPGLAINGTLTLTNPSEINYVFSNKLSGTPITPALAHLTASIKYCGGIDCRNAHPLYKHIYLYRAYEDNVAHIDKDGVRELARLIPLNKNEYIEEVKDLFKTESDISKQHIIKTIDTPMLDSVQSGDDVPFTYKETMQLLLKSMISPASEKIDNWFDEQLLTDADTNSNVPGRDIFIKDGKEYYKDPNGNDVKIDSRYYGKLVKDNSMGDMDDNYCPIAGLNPEMTGEKCDTLIRKCMIGDQQSLKECKSVLTNSDFWKKVIDDFDTLVPSDAKKILDTCKFIKTQDEYETVESWLKHIATSTNEISPDEVKIIKENTRLVQYLRILRQVVNAYLKKKNKANPVAFEGVYANFPSVGLSLQLGGHVSPISDLVYNIRGGGSDDVQDIITGIERGSLKYKPVAPLYKRDISELMKNYEKASGTPLPDATRNGIIQTLRKMESYETNLNKLRFGLQQYIIKYKTDTDHPKALTNISDIIDMATKYKTKRDKIDVTVERLSGIFKLFRTTDEAFIAHTLPRAFAAIYT